MLDHALNHGLFLTSLESGIDVGQGISVGPGKFVKKNKHMPWINQINVGHEQNVQSYVKKTHQIWKIR